MRAVWSFWTRPFQAHRHRIWASEKHHLLAWVLSLETARRHFRATSLITDDDGARLLVDGVGLKFDHVSTELNALNQADPEWWCLGKLFAYRSQAEPFVHIDSDCFLWNPLPERMTSADLLAQNPEWFPYGGGPYYRPDIVESAVDSVQGWMPEELRWYTSVGGDGGVNCGILGGNRLDFIRHYADTSIRLAQHSSNQGAWIRLEDRIGRNLVVEQYLLAACIEYHKVRPDSPHHGLDVQYLFGSLQEAFEPERAARAGFTHLIAFAKSDPDLARRLEARVRRDFPEYYERCARYVNGDDEAATEPRVSQEGAATWRSPTSPSSSSSRRAV
jgi:hypothetical protein